MSKKSFLILGIIFMAFGGALIPTGYFLNNYFVEQVAEGVPDALLGIQDEAIPSLEDKIPVLATPDVLMNIAMQAFTQVNDSFKILSTPSVLLGIREEALDQFPFIINCSGAALAINQTLEGVGLAIGLGAAKEQFFNSPIFQASYGTMQGVSDYYDTLAGNPDVVNLDYNKTTRNYLLYGNNSFLPLPGLMDDMDLGMGVAGFLQLYLNVTLGIGPVDNTTLQFGYNASWTQIEALAGYIQNYVWEQVVKPQWMMAGYATLDDYAEALFYEQWANGTINGASVLPFGLLSMIDVSWAGPPYFEVGLPTETEFSLVLAEALWDEADPNTFVHVAGIQTWLYAAAGDIGNQTKILTDFAADGLTVSNMTALLIWLANPPGFYPDRVEDLLVYEYGYPLDIIPTFMLHEQWANGTIGGSSVIPNGFLAELDPMFALLTPFEVGLPTPTGLSRLEVSDLWNPYDGYSFFNSSGILIWLGAATNTTLQDLLKFQYGISDLELLALLTWLGDFIEETVPILILIDTGYTIPQLAQFLFYEQWANGTVYGGDFLPDGFLSERDPPIYGPPYFEVGLTIGPTGLSVAQCEALWDEDSAYSLVTVRGINKWYNAKEGNAAWEELKTENGGLSDAQMADIKEWLPKFRDVITNKLAKDELSLPMEPYDLGNTIFIAGAAGGGALAALGVVLAILSRRKI